ncbi:MAG: HAD hydrolase-like protein [Proteobacteria bacterium]|nr:HAD hydrolase-like protein [Pseudomonadota bacterium]
MKLILFDIDGTLLDTSEVDGECYAAALEMELGLTLETGDWGEFTHVTDAGILDECFRRVRGRPPGPKEITTFIERFIDLLGRAHARDPDRFSEIPGAGDILRLLSRTSDCRVGLATGGWRASALFKLTRAGLPYRGLPLSTSNEGMSREAILSDCISKAGAKWPETGYSKIVSVGDGAWDVRTARVLGLGFVGVGDEATFEKLGVRHVVRDFRDPAAFFRLLDSASKA